MNKTAFTIQFPLPSQAKKDPTLDRQSSAIQSRLAGKKPLSRKAERMLVGLLFFQGAGLVFAQSLPSINEPLLQPPPPELAPPTLDLSPELSTEKDPTKLSRHRLPWITSPAGSPSDSLLKKIEKTALPEDLKKLMSGENSWMLPPGAGQPQIPIIRPGILGSMGIHQVPPGASTSTTELLKTENKLLKNENRMLKASVTDLTAQNSLQEKIIARQKEEIGLQDQIITRLKKDLETAKSSKP